MAFKIVAPLFNAASEGLIQPVNTPIDPTKPEVPIPEEIGGPFISNLKTTVAKGPVIAEAKMGGIQILGFLIIFGICSIDVPIP